MTLTHCESACAGLECANAHIDCTGIIIGEHIKCGTPLCKECLARGECITCGLTLQREAEPPKESDLIYRDGAHSIEVKIGSRFKRDDVVWELVYYLGRDHSFTSGSAPCFACKPIQGMPSTFNAERYTEEGFVCFNTDSMKTDAQIGRSDLSIEAAADLLSVSEWACG